MRNIRLVLAYDGTDFHGWQRQPDLVTVQGCLETALAKLLDESVTIWGSGRTDAGVHALNQVAHFKTTRGIPCENLLRALNNVLSPSLRAKRVEDAPEGFHARYDAKSKTYRYRILQAPICSPFLARYVYHYPIPLDRGRMAGGARRLEGEHDFTSFASHLDADAKDDPGNDPKHGTSNVRKIFHSRILWRPRPSILIYEVKGSGFLPHMVRNIVGTLIEVGKGRLLPEDISRILEGRDRRQAGPAAPPQGLFLVRVEY